MISEISDNLTIVESISELSGSKFQKEDIR